MLFNTKISNTMNPLVSECCLTRSVPLMDNYYVIVYWWIVMLLSTYESVCYCLLVDVTSNVGCYVYRWTLFYCLLMDRHVNWELLSTTDGLSCYRLVFVFWWIITRLSSGGPCCCPQLDNYFLLMDFYLIVHRWSALPTRPSSSCHASVHRLVLEL